MRRTSSRFSRVNPRRLSAFALTAFALLPGQAMAQAATAPASNPLDLSGGQEPTNLQEALLGGQIKLWFRFRNEFADQRGRDTSQAYNVRTRLGYQTKEYEGFQAYLEFEDVRSFNDDLYNAAGLNGQGNRSVIADPEVTELNQAWLSYKVPVDGMVIKPKIGRQRIVFDDARFVGDVGWRLDNQTFDAFRVDTNAGVDGLNVVYAYIDQVNRIFAEDRDFDSESHLLNASYKIKGVGKLTAFAYLLDFDNSAANSSQTYGVRLAGKQDLDEKYSVNYAASYAFQSDFASNTVDYDASYYSFDLSGTVKGTGTFGAGYEVLGSDDGAFAFRTPLATGHKFNGFADLFLVTPAAGLEDVYIYAKTGSLPYGINAMVAYHMFFGDDDDTIGFYGDEIDVVLKKKINKHVLLLIKYAHFESDEPGFTTTDRLTFDINLTF